MAGSGLESVISTFGFLLRPIGGVLRMEGLSSKGMFFIGAFHSSQKWYMTYKGTQCCFLIPAFIGRVLNSTQKLYTLYVLLIRQWN